MAQAIHYQKGCIAYWRPIGTGLQSARRGTSPKLACMELVPRRVTHIDSRGVIVQMSFW